MSSGVPFGVGVVAFVAAFTSAIDPSRTWARRGHERQASTSGAGELPPAPKPDRNEPAILPGVTLSWHAPKGCPSQQDVAERLQAALAQSITGRPVAARAVVTSATNGSDRLRLKLSIQQGGVEATRTLRASDCEILADLAATLVASAIATSPDPSAAIEISDANAGHPRATETSTRLRRGVGGAPRFPDEPVAADDLVPQRARFVGHVLTGLGVAHSGSPGGVVQIAAGAAWRRARVAGQAGVWTGRAEYGESTQLWMLGVVACPAWRKQQLELLWCGGFHAGVTDRRAGWVGASTSMAFVGHVLPWLAVRGGAEMLVTIFNDEDPLRAIGGVFNLGVEFGAQLRTR